MRDPLYDVLRVSGRNIFAKIGELVVDIPNAYWRVSPLRSIPALPNGYLSGSSPPNHDRDWARVGKTPDSPISSILAFSFRGYHLEGDVAQGLKS